MIDMIIEAHEMYLESLLNDLNGKDFAECQVISYKIDQVERAIEELISGDQPWGWKRDIMNYELIVENEEYAALLIEQLNESNDPNETLMISNELETVNRYLHELYEEN